MTDSTLSSNSGGGLVRSSGSATLTNTTLVGNSGGSIFLYAIAPPPVPSAQAGAVVILATLTNSLVDTCVFSNVSATALADNGGNLDAGTSCLGAAPASASSRSNANLDLGPLQDNGGPTRTMLPGPASDAIDAGIDSACAAAPVSGLDQRGVARPQGLYCDAGAVELRPCYVKYDATGSNDGSSWANAYTDLQSGLAAAGCDDVLVARGVYKPTATSDRSISFNVRPRLGLYGGYSGIGSQRDPAVFRTALSGDIDINDGGTNGVDADTSQIVGGNSYRVVWIDGTTPAGPVGAGTILDGFTITGGKGDGPGLASYGAGVFCNGDAATCSPTFANLVFSGNLASLYGGALYNNGEAGQSSPQIANTTFTGNKAADGGAIYDDGAGGESSPSLANVTFAANSATDCGAAIYDDATLYGASSPIIRSATFANNTGTGNGGSAVCDFTATGVNATALTNVILWGNTSPEVSTYNGGSTLDHVVIQENACPPGSTCTTLIGTDPHLGALADNGGFTPTLMLGAGSSAIDAGLDSACAAPANVDQRGLARPQGAHCDIGAVEATNLSLSISDGRLFGFYGSNIQYVVTLQNKSLTDAIGNVLVSGLGSAGLDDPGALWFCTIGGCTTTSTSGPFADTATLPANSSLTWLVNVPVFPDSNEASATMVVRSNAAASVQDTDTLAIFRSTFE